MCVFCKIINGEIPSYKIFENDYVIAFLDISQETTGHTLVLPKKHISNVLELDEEINVHLATAILKITKILQNKLNCDNFNILNNCGELAGQTVKHLHVHIIPQHQNEHFSFNHNSHEPDFNKLALTHKTIIAE